MVFIKVFLLLIFSGVAFSQNLIINENDDWKYYDQGNIHGTGWKADNLNDDSWAYNVAPLGYGTNVINTSIEYGGDDNDKYISSYFRKSFNLNYPTFLKCKVRSEDGVVVYLNSQEVFRNNLPSGTVGYSTLNLNQSSTNEWVTFYIPSNLTSTGSNTFSVETHLNGGSDPELIFDFSCEVVPPNGIYINEVVASNSTILDINNKASDWVEIFNNTDSDLDLSNYYITDSKAKKTKFRFTNLQNQLVVPSRGYKIIWANSTPDLGIDHTSFSLSASGEHIMLVMPNGITVVDSFSFPKQKVNVSIGRLYSKIDSLVYFSPVSYNIQNEDSNAYIGFLSPPIFSKVGGFYSSDVNLSLTQTNIGATIMYSTDASVPDSNNLSPTFYSFKNVYPQNPGDPLGDFETRSISSFNYISPIIINNPENEPNQISKISSDNSSYAYEPPYLIPKARVIRAVCQKQGYLSSDVITNTYFFRPNGLNEFSMPVYSLVTQESNLYDYNTGIATAGITYDNLFNVYGRIPEAGNFGNSGKQWEREGNIEVFNGQDTQFNENIKLRVHGKVSRQFNKKSFRLYFDSPKYLFSTNPTKLSNQIILRNPREVQTNDVASSIAKGINADVQESKPIVLYLDGEYWGVYNITDYVNEDFIAQMHVVNSKNLDIYKDGLFDQGTNEHYDNLMSFLENNDFSIQSNFDSLTALIDIDNFTDYIISETFLNNTDWPYNNTFVWRNKVNTSKISPLQKSDGRWRWTVVDLDGTLVNPEQESISTAIGEIGTALVFNKLLNLENFKIKFINRYCDLVGSHFLYSRTVPISNATKVQYIPEIPQDIARWQNTTEYVWDSSMTNLNYFLNERNANIYIQLRNTFSIDTTYNLQVQTNDITKGYVHVNSISILPTTSGIPNNPVIWNNRYFKSVPLTIKAKAKPGYRFSHWIHDSNTLLDSVLVVNTTNDNESYIAYFQSIPPGAFVLNDCPYKFNAWPSSSPALTYPNSIRFVNFQNLDPLVNENITSVITGAYNFLDRTRINGQNTNGFSFINTSGPGVNLGYENGKLGGAILALNTEGVDSVKINWVGRTFVAGTRKYAIKLQYREGDSGVFNDFNSPNTYNAGIEGNSQSFVNIKLPNAIINKPYVQLMWRYYFTNVGSGSRDQLGVDDIELLTYKHINSNTISNTLYNNTSYYKIETVQNANLNVRAEKSIFLNPGFEVDNNITFEAKIAGCNN